MWLPLSLSPLALRRSSAAAPVFLPPSSPLSSFRRWRANKERDMGEGDKEGPRNRESDLFSPSFLSLSLFLPSARVAPAAVSCALSPSLPLSLSLCRVLNLSRRCYCCCYFLSLSLFRARGPSFSPHPTPHYLSPSLARALSLSRARARAFSLSFPSLQSRLPSPLLLTPQTSGR